MTMKLADYGVATSATQGNLACLKDGAQLRCSPGEASILPSPRLVSPLWFSHALLLVQQGMVRLKSCGSNRTACRAIFGLLVLRSTSYSAGSSPSRAPRRTRRAN
jgi:hypothetical protein